METSSWKPPPTYGIGKRFIPIHRLLVHSSTWIRPSRICHQDSTGPWNNRTKRFDADYKAGWRVEVEYFVFYPTIPKKAFAERLLGIRRKTGKGFPIDKNGDVRQG